MSISISVDVDEGFDVDVEAVRAIAAHAIPSAEHRDAELTIRIAGDELLQQLNRDHRGSDEPTDVLSFPASDEGFPDDPDASEDAAYLGDIAISVPAARRNAELTGTPMERELQHLVTHGVLHLLGYDHESEDDAAAMRSREVELLGEWVHAIWDAPPTH